MTWGCRNDGPVQAIATDPATDLRMLHLVAAQAFGAESPGSTSRAIGNDIEPINVHAAEQIVDLSAPLPLE